MDIKTVPQPHPIFPIKVIYILEHLLVIKGKKTGFLVTRLISLSPDSHIKFIVCQEAGYLQQNETCNPQTSNELV